MTTSAANSRSSEIAVQYVSIWNETNAQQRNVQIRRLFSPKINYADPLMQAAGYDELNDMISAAQSQFAGLRFNVLGKQDAHHDVVRFSWSLGVDNDDPIACGTDIAWMTPDGRIDRILGFIDKMPS